MKIAIIIPTLTLGGAEKIARDTALCFAEQGHIVTLILFTDKQEFNVSEKIEICKNVKNIFALIKVLRNGKFDLCISYMERANLLASVATKILNIKHCATVHTAPAAGFKLRSKKNRFAISLTYYLLKLLNTKVVGVCDGIVADLKRMYGIKNTSVIPNFINTAEILHQANEEDIKEKFDFIFVGRLTKVKGCHIFIEALAKIKDILKEKNVRVAIIGNGPELDDIKKAVIKHGIEDHIKMLGAKKNPYPFIKASSYIVVPSYAEGFGMVVLEGLALGARVIFSRCDFGPREIINNNFKELSSLGFKNPATDSQAAIKDLKRILESELKCMTPFDYEFALERVQMFYNKEKVCGQFLDIVGKGYGVYNSMQ